MKLLQSVLLSGAISISITFITLTILTVINDYTWTAEGLLKQLILAIILGIIIGIANLLFMYDSWSYRRILVVHYIFILLAVFFIGSFGGWYTLSSPLSIVILFLQTTIIYTVVWFNIFLTQKKDIYALNKLLEENREESNDVRNSSS